MPTNRRTAYLQDRLKRRPRIWPDGFDRAGQPLTYTSMEAEINTRAGAHLARRNTLTNLQTSGYLNAVAWPWLIELMDEIDYAEKQRYG